MDKPTPRTDAVALDRKEGIKFPDDPDGEPYFAWTDYWALLKVARELEQELFAVQLLRQAAERTIARELEARNELEQTVARLRAALQEVYESIPASFYPNDPMVQRHSRALNAIPAALKKEPG